MNKQLKHSAATRPPKRPPPVAWVVDAGLWGNTVRFALRVRRRISPPFFVPTISVCLVSRLCDLARIEK